MNKNLVDARTQSQDVKRSDFIINPLARALAGTYFSTSNEFVAFRGAKFQYIDRDI
jgi:hypothetical protein